MRRELGSACMHMRIGLCVCACERMSGVDFWSWQVVKDARRGWTALWNGAGSGLRSGLTDRRFGLVTDVWNSCFVIWNTSEISNEIWSIMASHSSQWNALCVRVSGDVLSFLLWSTEALDGGGVGRGRERGSDFPLELTGLSLSYLKFFSFSFSFVWPLSKTADCYVCPHA